MPSLFSRLVDDPQQPPPQKEPSESTSAVFCGHANEMPSLCECPSNCYCKANSCKNPARIATNPPFIDNATSDDREQLIDLIHMLREEVRRLEERIRFVERLDDRQPSGLSSDVLEQVGTDWRGRPVNGRF